MLKLLIDECLTLELVDVARRCGHPQSSHIVRLGKAGWKDWQLKPFLLEGDWTFVTRNSVDFRGNAAAPGRKGQYADVSLHAGLICLNGQPQMTSEDECALLEAVLHEIGNSELTNEVVEATLQSPGGDFLLKRYSLP